MSRAGNRNRTSGEQLVELRTNASDDQVLDAVLVEALNDASAIERRARSATSWLAPTRRRRRVRRRAPRPALRRTRSPLVWSRAVGRPRRSKHRQAWEVARAEQVVELLASQHTLERLLAHDGSVCGNPERRAGMAVSFGPARRSTRSPRQALGRMPADQTTRAATIEHKRPLDGRTRWSKSHTTERGRAAVRRELPVPVTPRDHRKAGDGSRRNRGTSRARSGTHRPEPIAPKSRGPGADLATRERRPPAPLKSSTRCFSVGLARIELATSSLSGMRSNRLSYSPVRPSDDNRRRAGGPVP